MYWAQVNEMIREEGCYAQAIGSDACVTQFSKAAKGQLAHNVLRLPTAREPTVSAAERCPPPSLETDFTARGGQRPEGRDAARA